VVMSAVGSIPIARPVPRFYSFALKQCCIAKKMLWLVFSLLHTYAERLQMKKKNTQSQKVRVQRLRLRPGSAKIQFGRYGLKSLETGLVRPKQLEVVRRAFLNAFRRKCST
jgi:hypothetical protein